MRQFTKYPSTDISANNNIFAMAKNNINIGTGASYWICDYVMYSLYLGDPAKFIFSQNGDSYTGTRKSGDTSGYAIDLKYNNHNISHKVHFQITSTGPDTVFVQGGDGATYVETDMTPANAIQHILNY